MVGVDVVHAPSVAVTPWRRAPLVSTVHDAAPVLFPVRPVAAGGSTGSGSRRRPSAPTQSSRRGGGGDEITEHTTYRERIRPIQHGVEQELASDAQVGGAARVRPREVPYVLWVGTPGAAPKGVGALVAGVRPWSQTARPARTSS